MGSMSWVGIVIVAISGLFTLLVVVTLIAFVVNRFRDTQPQRRKRG